MRPEKKDFPIIAELEDVAHLYYARTNFYMAELLRQAAKEIYRAHYNAWEVAMGEDI